jgi:hypothetical protein
MEELQKLVRPRSPAVNGNGNDDDLDIFAVKDKGKGKAKAEPESAVPDLRDLGLNLDELWEPSVKMIRMVRYGFILRIVC